MQTLHRSTTALLWNAAVTLLRAERGFQRASRRLLADLVEHAGVVRLSGTKRHATVPFLLIVVQGPLVVTAAPESGEGGAAEVVVLRGVHWGHERLLQPLAGRAVTLRAAPDHTAYVVDLDEATLKRLLAASPALAALPVFRRFFGAGTLTHEDVELIWMALAPGVRAPLAALTELLAAATGSQFAEPAGMVTLGGTGPMLDVWREGARTWERVPLASAAIPAIVTAFRQRVGGTGPARLFFVDPGRSSVAPGALAGAFHRVVFVTDRELDTLPDGLDGLLHRAVHPRHRTAQADGTILSSFVPCRLVPAGAGSRPSLLAGFLRALPWCLPGGFRALPLDDGWPSGCGAVPPAAPRLRRRLRKDQCRLALDVPRLASDWARWRRGAIGAASFPAFALALDTPLEDATPAERQLRETAYRWARAVTNRRVGVALSGGGACAYRAVPLLEMLRHRDVPIDLFSGASGGALLGAYYCTGGVAGLRRARQRGLAFLLASLAASLWSGTMELQVDADLGGTRVEDLEVIFLPVTTALGDPPVASVVVGGSLGEAVRASGSALFSFGPTRKGALRYADGSTATMIPAKVLTDHGADLVLACNCIPGPLHGNPFGGYMIGKIAYRLPIVSRMIDTWVGSSYLLTTASRMAGIDAAVYWEPAPVWDPLLEAPHFERADEIVADSMATDGDAMAEVAERMRNLWTVLGR